LLARFRAIIAQLASTSGFVTTSAVLQHEVTHIQFAGAIDDRTTYGVDRIALLDTPQDMHRNVALWIQRINHESVSGVNGFFVAKIKHDKVVVNLCDSQQLLAELVLM
jgi:hypothetical protein